MADRKKFYLTTAINYTNGSPHIGHAYEIICADIIARYQRLYGFDVMFTTGADNYGQKIADTAKLQNLLPIELCDKYVEEFKKLNKMLNVSADRYIRTTDKNHISTVKMIWKQVSDKGDIYLGDYEGWYSITDEKFVTKTEALKLNYLDTSNKPLVMRAGPSYFFRLSNYADIIKNYINDNPNFIFPTELRDEILTRLNTPIEDLSISRTRDVTDWGIEIDNSDHVVYVWFDALINYLSVIGYSNGHVEWWAPDVHVIGKDICWFHSVIWLGMLMSLDLELPKTVLCHGFINDKDGLKMSKSKGNVIDPFDILVNYNPDVLRCYLAYMTNIGADLCISHNSMVEFSDHHLVAKFSNLANRCLVLTTKLNNGLIPDKNIVELFSISIINYAIGKNLGLYQIKDILNAIFIHLDIINKFVSDMKPWEKNGDYLGVIKTALEAVFIVAHFLYPFIPTTCDKLFTFLNTQMVLNLNELSWDNLIPGNNINSYSFLFTQIGETSIEKKRKTNK